MVTRRGLMKFCHTHLWSTLQLLTVLWWNYIQETTSCYVVKGSEQIAKQGRSCTRIWVNKCSLVRKCKNSSYLQERELETSENELGRECTLHEKSLNSEEIFIQVLVLATQVNWPKDLLWNSGKKSYWKHLHNKLSESCVNEVN